MFLPFCMWCVLEEAVCGWLLPSRVAWNLCGLWCCCLWMAMGVRVCVCLPMSCVFCVPRLH